MTPHVTIMQVLAYVFASFYFSEWMIGTCSDVPKQNDGYKDPLISFSPESKEDAYYLETTVVPVPERSPHESFANDFLKAKPLVSDPLFEDMSWNKSGAQRMSRKRDVFQGAWSRENKVQILQLHNVYRSNVTPPAGNMAYMEWDDELEKLAQIWADRCIFEHGMPDNNYSETIGQNLYIGTDPTGYLGLYMWYEEYHHYELRNEHCLPNKQCGHYVQMAWSESTKLGCAMAKCNMRYYVVCHYSPQALRGVQMYRVATPCSQCQSKKGVLCLKNLCMTREQCKNHPFDCQYAECNLKCQNCGRLDKEKCECVCKDGWDSPDCSHLCANKHKRCGMSPGWPTKASCSLNGYAVAKTYCRQMCEMCEPLVETSNNTCCGKKLCDEGFVLDPSGKSCKCILLCPGILCDGKDPSKTQASLESGADCLRIAPYFIMLFYVLLLCERVLRKYV